MVLPITSAYAQKYTGDPVEVARILETSRKFSAYYVAGNIDSLAAVYSEDAKILPPDASIIEGREAIRRRWTLPPGVEILHHAATPEEITIEGNYAYDVGYYEGSSRREGQARASAFRGKYVIVWKKEEGDWKMYLDIWNSLGEDQ